MLWDVNGFSNISPDTYVPDAGINYLVWND